MQYAAVYNQILISVYNVGKSQSHSLKWDHTWIWAHTRIPSMELYSLSCLPSEAKHLLSISERIPMRLEDTRQSKSARIRHVRKKKKIQWLTENRSYVGFLILAWSALSLSSFCTLQGILFIYWISTLSEAVGITMLDQTPVLCVFHYYTIIEKVQRNKERIDIYYQEKISPCPWWSGAALCPTA